MLRIQKGDAPINHGMKKASPDGRPLKGTEALDLFPRLPFSSLHHLDLSEVWWRPHDSRPLLNNRIATRKPVGDGLPRGLLGCARKRVEARSSAGTRDQYRLSQIR
jgi:hypothetical protein